MRFSLNGYGRLTANHDFANRRNAENHGNQNGDRYGQTHDLFNVGMCSPFVMMFVKEPP